MAITIHVLSNGELFRHILNATSTFIYGNGFTHLIKIGALVGIILCTVQFIKTRDHSVYARWFVMYLIITTCVIAPRTSVIIDDASQQLKANKIDNVPVAFALLGRVITSVGFGLASSFDMLMSMPEDMQYTKTGMLFGSHVMQEMHKQRIQDSELKSEFSGYFRNCIVGDVRLLQKYSIRELKNSTDIGKKVFDSSSTLRRTTLRDGETYSCNDAGKKIEAALNKEIDDRTYKSLWAKLVGKPIAIKGGGNEDKSDYAALIGHHISLGAAEFQGMRDESTNILRQTLLINALNDGVRDYQSYTGSQAGLTNYNFSKSQVQHRAAWSVMGEKATWFLPLLHTILLLIMFGIFPIILAISVTPLGGKIFQGYLAFFISLQLWPVIYAIINLAMTYYGKKHSLPYGGLSMANIDSVDQVHSDLEGMAGYAMFFIPTIAFGMLSKGIGTAMNHNATSTNSHTQGTTMGIAAEVAGGNISVGQSSYMNTNSNNLSANKHDSNYTNMHGMSTQQLSTGAHRIDTDGGDHYMDGTQAMSRGAVSVSGTSGIQHSLSNAKDNALVSANSHQTSFNDSIQKATSDMISYSKTHGHDLREGQGGSTSETSSEQQALSRIMGVASDVAQRTGMSQSDALNALSSVSMGAHAGLDSKNTLLGKLVGVSGGVSLRADGSNSSNHANSASTGVDQVLSAKEFSDFKSDLQSIASNTRTNHFDNNNSQGESLLQQSGADLRRAQSEANAYTASLTESQRISNASNYVKSDSANISSNLTQEAFKFGEQKYDRATMDDLYAHPGDANKMAQLEQINHEFLDQKAHDLIDAHGDFKTNVVSHNKAGMNSIKSSSQGIEQSYYKDNSQLKVKEGDFKSVPVASSKLNKSIDSTIDNGKNNLAHHKQEMSNNVQSAKNSASSNIEEGRTKAQEPASTGSFKSGKKAVNDLIHGVKHPLGGK